MGGARRFEDVKRLLSRKARELDEQYRVREKIAEVATTVREAVQRGADLLAEGIETAHQRVEQSGVGGEVRDEVKRTVEEVRRDVESAAQAARARAEEFARRIQEQYRQAETLGRAVGHAARAEEHLRSGWAKVRSWIRENPGKTAAVTFSFIAGVRAAGAFPTLGASLLGLGGESHWFFHSALAPYGLRRLSEMYVAYLRRQERLLAEGKVTEAERARLEFQRAVTRYVGAPLLGVFSVTLGGTLIAESFSPTRLTGAPLELIFGGNPILNSLWLFSNGLICLHTGARFFLIAFAEAEEVHRAVREIVGALPDSISQERA